MSPADFTDHPPRPSTVSHQRDSAVKWRRVGSVCWQLRGEGGRGGAGRWREAGQVYDRLPCIYCKDPQRYLVSSNHHSWIQASHYLPPGDVNGACFKCCWTGVCRLGPLFPALASASKLSKVMTKVGLVEAHPFRNLRWSNAFTKKTIKRRMATAKHDSRQARASHPQPHGHANTSRKRGSQPSAQRQESIMTALPKVPGPTIHAPRCGSRSSACLGLARDFACDNVEHARH